MFNRLRSLVCQPVSATHVSVFRIVYGVFMIIEMLYYIGIEWIRKGFLLPQVLFPFDYLEWLRPLPAPLMLALPYLMLAAAVLITIGWKSRWAAAFFGVAYLYLILLDRSFFNNHFYLFSLLALLMSAMPIEANFSVQNYIDKKPQQGNYIPRLYLMLLQFQIGLVYFYGGVVKLTSYDWVVRQEPIRSILKNNLHAALTSEIWVHFFSVGGLLFDLGIVFLLMYRRTRWLGFLSVLFFNLTNSQLFNDIGIFPFVMLFSTFMFFEPDFLDRHWFSKRKTAANTATASSPPTFSLSGFSAVIWSSYVVFQLLFPLRNYFLSGNTSWHTIGSGFSWRMKNQIKQMTVPIEFVAIDEANGKRLKLSYEKMINTMQFKYLKEDPRTVVLLGRKIASNLKEKGIMQQPAIFVKYEVSLNNRPSQAPISPTQNLVTLDYYNYFSWINPLK